MFFVPLFFEVSFITGAKALTSMSQGFSKLNRLGQSFKSRTKPKVEVSQEYFSLRLSSFLIILLSLSEALKHLFYFFYHYFYIYNFLNDQFYTLYSFIYCFCNIKLEINSSNISNQSSKAKLKQFVKERKWLNFSIAIFLSVNCVSTQTFLAFLTEYSLSATQKFAKFSTELARSYSCKKLNCISQSDSFML